MKKLALLFCGLVLLICLVTQIIRYGNKEYRDEPDKVTKFLSALYYLNLFFGSETRVNMERCATLTRSLESAPYLSNLKILFPKASLNFRYFSETGEPGINVETIVYDRYKFRMTLPAFFEHGNDSISSYGDPVFIINEITEIEPREGRLGSTSYGEQYGFGKNEWRQIVKSGGDFQTAGIELRQNDPVDGIEYVWGNIKESMTTTNTGITSEWRRRDDQ
jgi:hypothetical protein